MNKINLCFPGCGKIARWHSRFARKKEYIGKPLFIEVNRVNLQENTGWRTNARMMGGGALLEGGVHWINMISQLGGGVKEVLALQPHTNYARMI
jgi:predicted dehydrogenase